MNGKRIVEDGYDKLAAAYARVRRNDSDDVQLLIDFAEKLPDGSRVLDAGCGSGTPVSRILSERFQVTGVDISAEQIALARSAVPNAEFIHADMSTLAVPDGHFDAIVSFYAIIHVPRNEHSELLANFRRMLVPYGLLLVSMGASDNPDGTADNWLDGGAPMYWSHYGRAENLRLIENAGFNVEWERLVVEDEEFGGGSHLFVLAVASD